MHVWVVILYYCTVCISLSDVLENTYPTCVKRTMDMNYLRYPKQQQAASDRMIIKKNLKTCLVEV